MYDNPIPEEVEPSSISSSKQVIVDVEVWVCYVQSLECLFVCDCLLQEASLNSFPVFVIMLSLFLYFDEKVRWYYKYSDSADGPQPHGLNGITFFFLATVARFA